MSAALSDRWPKLSAPIYAGDNFRIARDMSLATQNRPAARPSLPRREARNQPDPPDYRYFTEHSYDELSHGY